MLFCLNLCGKEGKTEEGGNEGKEKRNEIKACHGLKGIQRPCIFGFLRGCKKQTEKSGNIKEFGACNRGAGERGLSRDWIAGRLGGREIT